MVSIHYVLSQQRRVISPVGICVFFSLGVIFYLLPWLQTYANLQQTVARQTLTRQVYSGSVGANARDGVLQYKANVIRDI